MALRPLALMLAGALTLVGCKKQAPVSEASTAMAGNSDPVAQKIPDDVINLAQNFTRVYFEFDSARLSAEGKTALDENVAIMTARPDIKLEIQGHADERGTTGYNLALGQRRAQSVARYMKSQGIAQSRLKVVSYGEERPLTVGDSESAWSKNRRCEFVITWSSSEDVQGTAEN